MKTYFAIIAMVVMPVLSGWGQTNYCFPVGEQLHYRLYWGVIPVGTAVFTSEWIEQDGTNRLLLRAVARTTSVVAKIYPVSDTIESVVDPVTFLPVSYTQILREGRHKRDDIIQFDHGKKVAVWTRGDRGATTNIAIEADTRDVLTLAYFMRGTGMEVGQTNYYRVVVDNKLYALELRGVQTNAVDVGEREDIPCLEVEPKAKFGQIFVRKGEVRLWFSLDPRKVCAKMSAKVRVASLYAELLRVEGPGTDEWISKPVEEEKPVLTQ